MKYASRSWLRGSLIGLFLISVLWVVVKLAFPDPRHDSPTLEVIIRHGDVELCFPEGLVSNAGNIPAARLLQYTIPVRNLSKKPFDLGNLEKPPCCSQAKFASKQETLAPGERGGLLLTFLPGEHPGPGQTRVPIVLKDADEEHQEPLFFVTLRYNLESKGWAAWSKQNLDFGKTWWGSSPVSKDLEFVVQSFDSPDKGVGELQELVCEDDKALHVEILGQSQVSGKFENWATAYQVRCTLNPGQSLPGKRGTSIVARCPLANVSLPVLWQIVEEYDLSPSGTMFLLQLPSGQKKGGTLYIRNMAGKPFQIVELTCNLNGTQLADESMDKLGTEHIVTLSVDNVDLGQARRLEGKVSLELLREDGERQRKAISCEIIRLQSVAAEDSP